MWKEIGINLVKHILKVNLEEKQWQYKLNNPFHCYFYTFALNYNLACICEGISRYFTALVRNCLASTLNFIVIQMRKTNRQNGY